jgi:uncharacterized membrane protein YdjX (TVP38/TMEM64 family)
VEWFHDLSSFDMNDIQILLKKYESLGPIPGILITLLESFLPFLPLFAIVMGNAAAYGLWEGFFYSWIGVSLGSIIVFFIFRRFGNKSKLYMLRKYPQSAPFFIWIEKRGFSTIFLFSFLPFTPSFIINIVSGISRVRISTFVIAILLSKSVMVFILSFLGHDIPALIRQPWKLLVIFAVIFGLWFLGKTIEAKLATR